MHTIRLLRDGQLIAEAQTGSSDTAYNASMAANLMQDGSDDWEIVDEAGEQITTKTDWATHGLTVSRGGLLSYFVLPRHSVP